MAIASLDLGTNSFLCLVSDGSSSNLRVIEDHSRVVRLGQDVDKTRSFHPEALARAEAALAEFSQIVKKHSVVRGLAVATSAARDVRDVRPLEQLVRRHGFDFRILTGSEEAECSFAGSYETNWGAQQAVVDIGGGSTEVIRGGAKGIEFRQSFNAGAVRMTERHLNTHPVPSEEIDSLKLEIDNIFSTLKLDPVDVINLVAGTPTTLAALILGRDFSASEIHGMQLDLAQIQSWRKRLQRMSVPQRQALPGMEPKRAEVLVAGLVILETVLSRIKSSNGIRVSVKGLRYGLAKAMLDNRI